MKKNKIVIIILILGILFLTSYLYNTYATSTGVSLGNDENTYDILLNDSTDTVSVPAKSSKTVYYQFSNTNKGTVKYHIGYTSDNVIAKVWWNTEDRVSGTIEYGEYKFIKLKLINDTTSDDTITIKPVLGYVNGGDVIPDSNTTLVTGTINETNTMSISPTNALNTLGIDKANVKELSFVKDNIPSSDSLGSTNMNDVGTIKLWYTNSDTSGLYNVYIGSDNGITSFRANCAALFGDFTKITLINLVNIDTSNVTGMSEMFKNCKNIVDLNLDNFDTSKVLYMDSMFSGCSKLTELDLSSFDTKKVTLMLAMFRGCSKLKKIDMSSFDTSNVIKMNNMFNGCQELEYLDVSNFNTSSVQNMSYMFNKCHKLKYLDVSSFDTSKVKYMSYMFGDCHNLTYLDVSNFDTSFVQNMKYMFLGCYKLVTIDVSNFDTDLVTDMHGMFGDCSSLRTLDLTSFNTSLVKDVAFMFFGCSNLQTINFGNNFLLNNVIEDKSASSYSNYTGINSFFQNANNLNNDTINKILQLLSTSGSGVQTKTLKEAGFTSTQANTATTLSNYQLFTDAGWTTGY